jgi:hypothetical protein
LKRAPGPGDTPAGLADRAGTTGGTETPPDTGAVPDTGAATTFAAPEPESRMDWCVVEPPPSSRRARLVRRARPRGVRGLRSNVARAGSSERLVKPVRRPSPKMVRSSTMEWKGRYR